MNTKTALSIQNWGNSLALRIPAKLARVSRLSVGQQVSIEATLDRLIVRTVGSPKLNLAQKLKQFDPVLHAGESMASAGRLGNEAM
ncbi:MAG: PbsX family transcriptional regulator [Lysobacterales bacterium CG02_land_8_20_14_3_00_62_12]|nr:MAG: PbsX family transcriptional regulator [Xanthomonadales bacterium CG02_land_8_20_14_3_00_62_12]